LIQLVQGQSIVVRKDWRGNAGPYIRLYKIVVILVESPDVTIAGILHLQGVAIGFEQPKQKPHENYANYLSKISNSLDDQLLHFGTTLRSLMFGQRNKLIFLLAQQTIDVVTNVIDLQIVKSEIRL
jgi:hypothetical protein